jgi:hypothetical protein
MIKIKAKILLRVQNEENVIKQTSVLTQLGLCKIIHRLNATAVNKKIFML